MTNQLDKKTFYRMVAFLRKYFAWSPQFREASEACKVGDGLKQCEGCDSLIHYGDTEEDYSSMYETILVGEEEMPVYFEKFTIDHIVPVGSLLKDMSLDYAAKQIFCDRTNLMGLCGACNYLKTRIDMEKIVGERKND